MVNAATGDTLAVEILNILGQPMKRFTGAVKIYKLDIRNWPPNIYYIKVTGLSKTYVLQLQKNNAL